MLNESLETAIRQDMETRVMEVKPRRTARQKLLKQQLLMREVNMGAVNNKHFRDTWRKITEAVQMPQIKCELEVAKNTFDRNIDIKCYSTRLALECLAESEEQRRRNVAQHIDKIKKFEEIQKDRLRGACIFYEKNLELLMEEFDADVEKIKAAQDDDETFLRAVICKGKRRNDMSLEIAISQTLFKLKKIREDGDNAIGIAAVQWEEKTSCAWNHLNKIISKYLSDTEKRRIAYSTLKARDNNDRKLIAHQFTQIAQLSESIRELREQISHLKCQAIEQIANTRSGKFSPFYRHYVLMKDQLYREEEMNKSRLKILTKEYNLTLKHLQRLLKKVQKISYLIRSCQRLQIQSDKILPLTQPHHHEVNEELNCLNVFWYRVGLAQSLMNEWRCLRDEVKHENDYLRECLKNRLT